LASKLDFATVFKQVQYRYEKWQWKIILISPIFVAELSKKLLPCAEAFLAECTGTTPTTGTNVEELVSCHLICGIIHHQLTDVTSALTHLHSVVNICANSPSFSTEATDKFHEPFAWYEIGIIQMRTGKFADALKSVDKCLQCAPAHSFAGQLGFRAKSARKYLERIA
jgi:hypothetical protein